MIFNEERGRKSTFTPIFLQAVAQALRDFPYVNASLDGDHIIFTSRLILGWLQHFPRETLLFL